MKRRMEADCSWLVSQTTKLVGQFEIGFLEQTAKKSYFTVLEKEFSRRLGDRQGEELSRHQVTEMGNRIGQLNCGKIRRKDTTTAPCENDDKDATTKSCNGPKEEVDENEKKEKAADNIGEEEESAIKNPGDNNNEKEFDADNKGKEKLPKNSVVICTPEEKGWHGLKEKIKKYPKLLKSDGNMIDFEKIFADEVKNRQVVLEDIFVSGREISILIAVPCNEQRPKVNVRYTTDSWETVFNKEAVRFTGDKDENKLFHRFFLTLDVPFKRDLKFAVRSKGELGTFWDNHYAENFSVEDVKENGNDGRLLAKFIPRKHAMFEELAKRKSVTMKDVSVKDGKVIITIATEENNTDPPGVLYTLDNWITSTEVTNAKCESKEKEQNVSKIRIDIPKEVKMVFAVFWRHDGIEFWDNNNGKNFEIQG